MQFILPVSVISLPILKPDKMRSLSEAIFESVM